MLTKRSTELELLDLGPDHYSPEEYSDCLKQLFRVNQLFGFFSGTVRVLKNFPDNSTLLDVGCGGGLFILHLSERFPHMKMMGTDISETAIHEAELALETWGKRKPDLPVSFHCQKQTSLNLEKNSVDIILATLVCHHMEDETLVDFLKQAHIAATKVVIINDLHRHRVAHWLYRLFSPLLFGNRLITHDGLISIRRGFTRQEWGILLQKADIHDYQLKWCFPFRWKLMLWKSRE